MAIAKSDKYGNGVQAITAQMHNAITRVCKVAVTVAAGKLTDGDLLKLCVIPANHVVTDLKLGCSDLDAGTALVFDAGLMVEGATALETVFVSGSTLGQAGGTLGFPATAVMMNTAAASADKVLAVEVTTTAGTIHAADGTFVAIVTYVPA